MYPPDDSHANDPSSRGTSYRFSHPVRYSVLAGVLSAVIASSLDMLLFAGGASHAVKVGIATGVTWFLVLLGILSYVRVKREPPP